MKSYFYAVALVLAACPALAGEIAISDAYARSNGPSATNGAVFMVIRAAQDDRLIGARTDAARMAEIHTHITDHATGLVKMRKLEDGLPVAGGAEQTLARGGDHVMLMGLTAPLEDGDRFELTLIFETAGEVQVPVEVDLDRRPKGHGGHGKAHGTGG